MSKSMELFTSRVYRKSRSESSVQTYKAGVQLFMKFLDIETMDQLAEKLEAGELNVVQTLNGWLDKLDKEDKSPQTQVTYFRAVKKFVEVCTPDLEVNWKRMQLPKIWRVEEDRIPTKEELREILRLGQIDDKVGVSIMASSGVRENTLISLTVGDVDLESYEDVGVVSVKPEKSKGKVGYVTFITPEAKVLLKQFLEYRQRRGEKLGKDSPLIRNLRAPGEEASPIGEKALQQRWIRLIQKAGKTVKPRRFHTLRMYTLKKFFRTNLELAGITKSFRERLLGHKGEYLDDAYFKPRVEQLLNEYRKAIPHLTIIEEVKYEQLRKRQALDTLKLLGFDEEKLKRVEEILARAKSFDEAMDEIRHLKDEEFTENNGSYINGNGFRAKVIGEAELLAHVEQGWDVVKELNDGKFIVRKQAV